MFYERKPQLLTDNKLIQNDSLEAYTTGLRLRPTVGFVVWCGGGGGWGVWGCCALFLGYCCLVGFLFYYYYYIYIYICLIQNDVEILAKYKTSVMKLRVIRNIGICAILGIL